MNEVSDKKLKYTGFDRNANKRKYIVKNIKTYSRVKKSLIFICISLVLASIISFSFFGFFSNSAAIRVISKYKDKDILKTQKTMTNPRIKFEHSKGSYYFMKAQKAVHQDDNNILLFNVEADGDLINIKSGELSITNQGNDLKFSESPVLIIKQNN
jgi:hypothetical protein